MIKNKNVLFSIKYSLRNMFDPIQICQIVKKYFPLNILICSKTHKKNHIMPIRYTTDV